MSRSVLPTVLLRSDTAADAIGQCDCNCDCACPTWLEQPLTSEKADWLEQLLSASSRDSNTPHFAGDSFQLLTLAESTYISPLAEGYWIAMNTLSQNGQVAVLNSSAYDLLDLFRNTNSIDRVLDQLRDDEPGRAASLTAVTRFIETDILVRAGWQPPKINQHSNTLVAWIHVTNECNLRCTYCYLSKTADKMSTYIGKKSIDSIFRSALAHHFRAIKLKFAGGEATLNFDVIIESYDYALERAKETGLELEGVVLSNGVGLTKTMARELFKRSVKLMISLDGLAPYNDRQRIFVNGSGSFSSVDRTIRRLLETELVPEISITVTAKNIDGLPDLLNYLLDFSLPFSINFYRENECSQSFRGLQFEEEQLVTGLDSAFETIRERMPDWCLLNALADRAGFAAPHNKTCGVGDNYIVIDQRGNVAKCQMAIRDTVGTIDEDDPLTLIRLDRVGIQNLPVAEKEGCRDCGWRNWCTGGCALTTYRATGRYDIKSPNCEIYKAIFPKVLHLEGLRILRQSEGSTGIF